MLKLDDKDMKIIEVMKDHGNWSFKQISLRTGIPTTTVHARVRKLEKDDIIKKYTIEIDHQKIGKGLLAHILVRINVNNWKMLINFLKHELKGNIVQEFSKVTGNYDFIIKARFSDMKELEKFLFRMVDETKTIHQTVTLISMGENF